MNSCFKVIAFVLIWTHRYLFLPFYHQYYYYYINVGVHFNNRTFRIFRNGWIDCIDIFRVVLRL